MKWGWMESPNLHKSNEITWSMIRKDTFEFYCFATLMIDTSFYQREVKLLSNILYEWKIILKYLEVTNLWSNNSHHRPLMPYLDDSFVSGTPIYSINIKTFQDNIFLAPLLSLLVFIFAKNIHIFSCCWWCTKDISPVDLLWYIMLLRHFLYCLFVIT